MTSRVFCPVPIAALLALLCTSCDFAGHQGHRTELQRSVSPDDLAVAQVVRIDSSGATDTDRFQVWLQYQHGKSIRPVLMLEVHRTPGVKMRWTDKRSLEVCYPKADITFFRNTYDYGEEGWQFDQWYWVEVFLRRISDLGQCGTYVIA